MSGTSGSEQIASVVVPKLVRTDGNIPVAANKWCESPIEAEAMFCMFCNASSFNSDLSEWIVVEGTDVCRMFNGCPCDDFKPVWEERRQAQKAKDECWERRLPWMVAIALYIRGDVREATIKMVFDIDGLIDFITTFM
jgi:hypothetical protein